MRFESPPIPPGADHHPQEPVLDEIPSIREISDILETEESPDKKPDTGDASISEEDERAAQAFVAELLRNTEPLADSLEEEVVRRYGGGFISAFRAKLSDWTDAMLTKGETAVNWVEEKGVPLPKSRLGMRILSAGIGTAGAVIPGGAVLMALSIVLWRREPSSRDTPASERNQSQQSYVE